MNYNEFKKVKLEDTGLICGGIDDKVFLILKKDNGIDNLQDLFEKYDNNDINYGNSNIKQEVRGVVDLLRFKYLKTPLKFDPYLNVYDNFDEGRLVQSCGLQFGPAELIETTIFDFELKDVILYDVFIEYKKNNYYKSNGFNMPEYKKIIFEERINLLLEYCKLVELGAIKPSQDKFVESEEHKPEVFDNVDWFEYNDAQLLENDEEVSIYAGYKRKIRNLKK